MVWVELRGKGNVPGAAGRRSDHVQPDDPVGGAEDDALDVVAVELPPPGSPHEFRTVAGHLPDLLVDLAERDVPEVPARVVAVGVVGPERQAADKDGLPLLARVGGELVVAVLVLDLDLEGVPADHCHQLPVELLVHLWHYMKSATRRAMSMLHLTCCPRVCCTRSSFRASSITSRDS